MYSFDKIKLLSSKVVDSIFKGEKSEELKKSKDLTDDEKDYVLSNILDKSKKQERLEFTSKLNEPKAWENFLENTNQKIETKPKYKVKQMYWYYAAAASIVILLSIPFFNKDNSSPIDTQQIIVNNIKTGTDKATLTLEDGTKVALEKGTTYQTANASSNGEKIVYNAGDNSTTEIAYNYLTIARGEQFNVTLADGTIVWLNSESQLKYPVAFIEGEMRQVELVYGEAYFDVSPSIEHNGAKFKVFHQSQEVEVLGTEFNIKAYKDESNIYTTLVEGKVAINIPDNNQILTPNQQANLNVNANTIEITTVDIHNETSWRKGLFSFKQKPLIEILQVLSRWYDIDDVSFESSSLEKTNFDGVLNKNQNINDILNIIKETGFISDYTITDKKITIR